MNPIDLLLYEHSALRIMKSEWENGYQRIKFEKVNEFVVNHHAKVEDLYIFPKIKSLSSQDVKLIKDVDRISADHKLIQTLGNNLVNWINANEESMVKRRMPLYWKILTEHNTSEEELIFYRWSGELNSTDDIVKSIRSFGVEDYIKITGISNLMLERYLKP